MSTCIEDEGDPRETSLDERYPCPNCGTYYSLGVSAPPLPHWLAEVGTDDEIEAWEAEHNYNTATCGACGWREDIDA